MYASDQHRLEFVGINRQDKCPRIFKWAPKLEDSEVLFPDAGQGRRRYSIEFKRQIVLVSMEPGVSTAEVAM